MSSLLRLSIAATAVLSMAGSAASLPAVVKDVHSSSQLHQQDELPRVNLRGLHDGVEVYARNPPMSSSKQEMSKDPDDEQGKKKDRLDGQDKMDKHNKDKDDEERKKKQEAEKMKGNDKGKDENNKNKMEGQKEKQQQDEKNKNMDKGKDDKDRGQKDAGGMINDGKDRKDKDEKDNKPDQMDQDDKNRKEQDKEQKDKEEKEKMQKDKDQKDKDQKDKDQKDKDQKDKDQKDKDQKDKGGKDKGNEMQQDNKQMDMPDQMGQNEAERKKQEENKMKDQDDVDRKEKDKAGKDQKNEGKVKGQDKSDSDNKKPEEGENNKVITDKKALYFLTNNEENLVACVEVGTDGKVTGNGAVISTGGKGASGLDWKTNQPATGSLFSQSSITVCDDHIFAVNPGSNTLSMFRINPFSPIHLTPVGEPLSLPGEFPNTVTASAKHKMVCVGMTGAKAGISCSSYSPESGLRSIPSSWREFAVLSQTTPPTGPYNTLSQVLFSPDETKLYATVKGDPRDPSKKGWFSSYDIFTNSSSSSDGEQSWLAEEEVRSVLEGTTEMSGCAPLPKSQSSGNDEQEHMLVTDPSLGGLALLNLDPKSKEASVKAKLPLPGQKHTAHITLQKQNKKSVWVSDTAQNKLLELSYEKGVDKMEVVGDVDLKVTGDKGLGDLKAVGGFLYALSPGDGEDDDGGCGITVVDTKERKLVQRAGLKGVGGGRGSVGMASWGNW
ncbi:hypothetical protein B0T21DRAFT_450637 [Apiosordaria backusii]|uniref:Uncharacterized protein n=1 Tax=Apiosordaria backusii TaxID=314023 RepID=A0AA40BNJ7_9PEZI|nr:hypothetical protein B0T21DRAFT_450637 [Apiosordaria backusii]